ncbi:MAG: PQQ-binding-like beta-propeller repeat protein [Pirellulaceae bacterium]|nr:PQQ-binding-like beta-propeller repeat protein [Pirellulaceae bacterium]
MKRPVNLCLTCALIFLSPAALLAENWPRFRGSRGMGVSAAPAPTTWDRAGEKWRVELPGAGHSSPVVWNDRVFVSCADADQGRRWIVSLDKESGAVVWRKSVGFSKFKKHKNNSFASATPAVDGQRVYALFHDRETSPLIAYTHSGEEVWRYELGPYLHGQGGASSPIVDNGSVYVANDHKAPSYLLSLDAESGKENWKVPREGKRACYATPCVRRVGDRTEIVFAHCFEGITGVDARSGRTNWLADVFGRFAQRAVASPLCVDDLVIAGSGAAVSEKNIVAVRPNGDQAAEVYRVTRAAPHVPTPVVYRGLMFLWSDKGIATCVDAETGQQVWQKRIGGNYFSSPICVGGNLYNVDVDGKVVVLKAAADFAEVARNDLGGPSKATAAAADGVLYFRTESHLIAIGK